MHCEGCEDDTEAVCKLPVAHRCVWLTEINISESLRSCTFLSQLVHTKEYRGADKSLARPTSRCILFDGSLVIQSVPGGKDLTSGECSLGQTIPI